MASCWVQNFSGERTSWGKACLQRDYSADHLETSLIAALACLEHCLDSASHCRCQMKCSFSSVAWKHPELSSLSHYPKPQDLCCQFSWKVQVDLVDNHLLSMEKFTLISKLNNLCKFQNLNYRSVDLKHLKMHVLLPALTWDEELRPLCDQVDCVLLPG